jgi:hypothetical protein
MIYKREMAYSKGFLEIRQVISGHLSKETDVCTATSMQAMKN